MLPFLAKLGITDPDKAILRALIPILKGRSKTLVEMAEAAKFCFVAEIEYEKKGDDKFLKKEVLPLLDNLLQALSETSPFDQAALEKTFVSYLEANEIKLKKIAQPLRMALTGKTASPGIFEVIEVLGKETVIGRIRKAIHHIKSK